MNLKAIDKRIARAKLEAPFQKIYRGYVDSGFPPEVSWKTACEQILPAVIDWETKHKEIVHAKRLLNHKKKLEEDKRRDEIAERIEAKEKKGESILEESHALWALDKPNPGRKFASDDPWGDLAMSIDPTRKADYRDVVEWVFNNVATPVEALSPLEAPSRGAVTMLQQVKEHPSMYMDFMRTHWAKLIPTKSTIEAESRFRDTNEKVFKLFDAFEEDIKKKRKNIFGRAEKTREMQDAPGSEESE